jgi:homoserine O-acetyltransferase
MRWDFTAACPCPSAYAADDERNPPELVQAQKALSRIKNLKVHLIPGSEETSGHGATGQARWWAERVRAGLQSAPVLKR